MREAADFPFVIEAEEVQRLRRLSGPELSLEAFLATLVEPTRALARTPVSNFHVGAVGLGASGRVFRGVNIEFAGLPLNFSIHAEQFLVANAARNGEHRLQFLAVSAAPCGHCRQFLQELRGAEDIRVLIVDGKAEDEEASRLSHFLPHRFGPQDLLEDDFPLLLEPQSNDLHLRPLETLAPSGGALPLNYSTSSTSPSLSSPRKDELTRVLEGTSLSLNSSTREEDGNPATLANFVVNHLGNNFAAAVTSEDDRPQRQKTNLIIAHEGNSPVVISDHQLHKQQQKNAILNSTASDDGSESLGPDQLGELQHAALEANQLIEVRTAALEAANASYAPYTGSPSGLALLSAKGSILGGPYFESAAYNPSLPPLQSAIVAFVADGGGAWEEIRKVVLVEKEGAPVQQAAVVKLGLQKISPKASFSVFQAQTRSSS